MKVGDLVRVQYQGDDTWYSGFLVEVAADDDPTSFYRMYCVERGVLHILSPSIDLIEVISEE